MNWASKDHNEIALNTIWSEHCVKEVKVLQRSVKTEYTQNPCSSIPMNNGLGMRMPFVTEKVGYAVGLEPIEVGNNPDVQAVVKHLLDALKTPVEKYDEPVTASQEVGWHSKPLVPSNPRFMHGLKAGDATKFAEIYTKKMAGEHMFHGKSGKYLHF